MDIETLYPLVTEAIRKAEVYEDIGAPGAMDAHRDVSLLEERVAKLLPASNPEGALARRGAVRAAVAAHDFARADALAEPRCNRPTSGTDLETVPTLAHPALFEMADCSGIKDRRESGKSFPCLLRSVVERVAVLR